MGSSHLYLLRQQENNSSMSALLSNESAARLELQGELTELQEREAELLSFHERLSSQNALLQAQHSSLTERVRGSVHLRLCANRLVFPSLYYFWMTYAKLIIVKYICVRVYVCACVWCAYVCMCGVYVCVCVCMCIHTWVHACVWVCSPLCSPSGGGGHQWD